MTLAMSARIAAVLCPVVATGKITEHRFEHAHHAYQSTSSPGLMNGG
jgi:hypothetical protein